MKAVGIVANPASGKDIRRLVAYGSVSSNSEKVNIVKRVLLGLDSVGVEEVHFMPDTYGLGARALDGLDFSFKACFLDMPATDSQSDSTLAGKMFNELGAACIVVLGGDGTNRVVAKGCGNTPLVSIATGTNNVFSRMIEGTLAGIAAGVAAAYDDLPEGVYKTVSRLEVWKGGELIDIALVDVIASSATFVGSRAIWDEASLKEIFLTRAEPGSIGFSSLGGHLCRLPSNAGKGLYIKIGPGDKKVKAPIAPGLIRWVPVAEHRLFEPGEELNILGPTVIALDGERELTVKAGETYTLKVNSNGPRVINPDKALSWAQENCLFISEEEIIQGL